MVKKQTNCKQTEIGEIPQEWDIKRFGDLAQLSKRIFNPKKEKADESDVYLGLEHFNKGGFSLNGLGQVGDIGSNKYKFSSGDILFGKLRPYFKKLYQPKFEGICSTDIWVIKPKQGIDSKYLFYLTATDRFLNKTIESSKGTKMPRASWDFVSDQLFPKPLLDEQQQIASILFSLDDKIELNRKINQNLEEMGKALFKHWFVDFEFPNKEGKLYKSSGGEMVDSELGEIPKGWEVGKLKDLIEITSGKRPKVKVDSKTEEYGVPIIGASGTMGYTQDILYSEKIIVTGRVGTLGLVQKIDFPCWMSDNALVIKSEYYEYVYRALSLLDFSSLNVGSTQPLITQTALKDIDIIIPQKPVLLMFEKSISCLTSKMEENNVENELLRSIRDSLLPRLMSGRLRV